MLTKNFYGMLACSAACRNIPNVLKPADGTEVNYDTTQGAGSNAALFFSEMSALGLAAPTSAGGVRIGTGKRPPSADDVNLESQITSGIYVTNQSELTYSVDENGIHFSATYGVRNNGADSLEVSEIGCYGKVKIRIGSSTTGTRAFLIERTVLETPVVIPAGESRQITYTISLRYPTA